LIEAIFELAAHETTHVINLYPFTANRVRWLRSPPLVATHDAQRPTTMDAEVRAVSVERCLRQAIMPRSIDLEADATAWLNDHSAFVARISREPELAIWDEVFRRQFALVGTSFIATKNDLDLEALFSQCAMYLQRTGRIDSNTVPNATERGVARIALRNIRTIAAPIRLRERPIQK
jgi:hypothetical protein